jgi:hypothetical protein
MFGWDQKDRLLRESWTADALAQELYAMFGDQVPNNTAAPVDVTLPMGSPVAPYQVTGAPDTGPALQITTNDGTVTNYNNDGTITTGPPDNQQPVNAIGGGGSAPGVPVWG